jgi:signal transduction histidine kinase
VISTVVKDRGEHVFSLIEKNRDFSLLKNIKVSLYYLNSGAKISFSRFMGGVSAKAYGSIFVYKNNFRISPYGEPGQDFFGIDSRKQQGFMRYLGTRELMGNIIIYGDNNDFIETSSRAHGFVNNLSVQRLSDFFIEKVLKILERYVTQIINWGNPLDDDNLIKKEDIERAIIDKFLGTIRKEDILKIEFGDRIIPHNTKGDSLGKQLAVISEAANDSNNRALKNAAESLRKKTDDLVLRTKNLEAENRQRERELSQANQEKEITKRQVFFLESASKQDINNLLNGYHSIYTLADATGEVLDKIRTELEGKEEYNSRIIERIAEVILVFNKVKKLSDLALNGNLSLKQTGLNDIYSYLKQYICTDVASTEIRYSVKCNKAEAMCKFDVTAIGIIVDNIVSNSIKARATELVIDVSDEEYCVKISFADNGYGLDPNIDPKKIFERGATLNSAKKGFGIGLPHIKELVDEMKGKVAVDSSYKNGFNIIMELRK